MDQVLDLTQRISEILDSKKAQDLTILSVKGLSPIADYFIIATGTSSTHINALADYVEKGMRDEGVLMRHKEGKLQGGWLLLDFRDIVVHIFSSDLREYYSLERIWSDAPRVVF